MTGSLRTCCGLGKCAAVDLSQVAVEIPGGITAVKASLIAVLRLRSDLGGSPGQCILCPAECEIIPAA